MRKFLVVVDDTPECGNAIRFAARRAEHTKGGLVMLYVMPRDGFEHWMGVAEVMREEAREKAEERLAEAARHARETTDIVPEFVIREGQAVEEILSLIREDEEIGVLVLGAGEDASGPGPLVTQMVDKLGHKMPVPVTVVPGAMTHERLDQIC
ncbi:MAG TPA: universal stress protein [Thermohalobaculum sp.]|nr:universal stress protein [Thermohalobaculum sp.]